MSFMINTGRLWRNFYWAKTVTASSPPAEKTTARQDQAGKSCTGDGARNTVYLATDTCDRVVKTEPFRAAAHRFAKLKLDTIRSIQQRHTDQVV
jgi:hypothetical protein